MSARMRLRRTDGAVYLDRWGFEWKRFGGVFLHRMDAGDPGPALHDHPWWFASFIIAGGYVEQRIDTRSAAFAAQGSEAATIIDADGTRHPGLAGVRCYRKRWSFRSIRLDECHRITSLLGERSWSLVIHGPTRRPWGFYTSAGWIPWRQYEAAGEREVYAEISSNDGDTRPKGRVTSADKSHAT